MDYTFVVLIPLFNYSSFKNLVVVVVVVVCFYLHPKEQLIIIEDKIEQRLKIGRLQLNDIRYNMHKKLCMVTAPIP